MSLSGKCDGVCMTCTFRGNLRTRKQSLVTLLVLRILCRHPTIILLLFTDSNVTKSVDKGTQVSDSSALIKLEEEMKKIKLQLENDILSEQKRANEAENKASLVAKAEERRVADLGNDCNITDIV